MASMSPNACSGFMTQAERNLTRIDPRSPRVQVPHQTDPTNGRNLLDRFSIGHKKTDALRHRFFRAIESHQVI
jgi:hypothetical protein